MSVRGFPSARVGPEVFPCARPVKTTSAPARGGASGHCAVSVRQPPAGPGTAQTARGLSRRTKRTQSRQQVVERVVLAVAGCLAECRRGGAASCRRGCELSAEAAGEDVEVGEVHLAVVVEVALRERAIRLAEVAREHVEV